MATNTAGTSARNLGIQAVHFIRKTITTADAATTVTVGIIPAGSVILKPISGVDVKTVFNAGTNNRLDIGPSTDSGTNLWGTLLTLLGADFVPLDEAVTHRVEADTTVQAYVDVTGTAATTGEAEIIICFIPDNDL